VSDFGRLWPAKATVSETIPRAKAKPYELKAENLQRDYAIETLRLSQM